MQVLVKARRTGLSAAHRAFEGNRKGDLAKIHLAKKTLGWDEDTYRDVLQSVCGVRSSADLDAAGRRLFLEHLQKCGWKPTGGAQAGGKARPVRKALTGPQRLMWSLWQQLADAGLVENRKMPALQAYVTRQTQVDRLEWLNSAQEALVIESLKQWLARAPKAPGGAV